MELVAGIIVGLLVLMLLVVGHEFGHFLMARRNGVAVEEFGIGFPPRAVAWRKVNGKWQKLRKAEWEKAPGEGLIVSLNWLPIGGFCRMKGESAVDRRSETFGRATFWQKTKILFGGVAVNWLIAIAVFTGLAWCGLPQFLPKQFTVKGDERVRVEMPLTIAYIAEGSPAQSAGLQVGDVFESASEKTVDGQAGSVLERKKLLTPDDLIDFNTTMRGKTVYYNMVHAKTGEQKTIAVALNGAEAEYALGVQAVSRVKKLYGWSAPIVGVMTTAQITHETFKGIGKLLYDLVTGVVRQLLPNEAMREAGKRALSEAGDSVSGPVGIIGVLFPAFVKTGPAEVCFLAALISVSLAVMNVLPIPALDGGRWLLILIYKLRKKELTEEKEAKIVNRAFAVILLLAAVVTVLDIIKLIQGA